jgi:hypothetical protein
MGLVIRLVTAVVVTACVTACDREEPSMVIAPTSIGTFEGTWTGTTSQSERFGFVVTGNFLTRLEFSGSYADGACVGGFSAIQTFSSIVPISDSQFSAASANPPGTAWSVSGRFVSPISASGTLQVSINRTSPPVSTANCGVQNIQVTWTAQKIS